MTLAELDVQRINLREPDGTLRLVISNATTSPGVFIKGQEFPQPDRKVAGMIFLNNEGSENGGLIFGGEQSRDGTNHSSGHLSFDAYEQDQTMALESVQDGKDRYTRLQMNDYPDYSMVNFFTMQMSIKKLPSAEQKARIKAFFVERGGPITRLELGRGIGAAGSDDSVMLGLNDTKGHPRIVMKVASDGTPSLQMLDVAGNVIGALPVKH